MILDGASRHQAAQQTGMDRQTLRDWVHRYNDLGVDGLISRSAPGRAPKLSPAQMLELRDWSSPVLILRQTGSCVGAASICATRSPGGSR